MAQKYDSIGLAGASVGIINLDSSQLKWAPRHEGDASPTNVLLEHVLRASWAPVGKMCHLRLFCKNGDKYRFDGFRRIDIDGLKIFFEGKDIDFEKENVASGGGNYGSLFVEGSQGALVLKRDSKQVFEMDLTNVTQCVIPATKTDELDIQFDEFDTNNRDDQLLYSMRLWVPGAQANEIQSSIQTHVKASSTTGKLLIEFDRELGVFLAPKAKYSIEMYESFLRMHGATFDFKVQYNDISRYYMLEKPTSGRHGSDGIMFYYFVICLSKPLRQGKQLYPYLVWQTQNEENEMILNLSEDEINEKYPNSGLQPTMEGALHKIIGKVFKVLTTKTVFAGSRKYKSYDLNQCISCNFGQRTGVLYPNEKSIVFLHQPVIVIEFNEIDYVEFEKSEQTRNFEIIIMKKGIGGEKGKKLQFGGIEKKEFNNLAEFIKLKDNYFNVRNYEPEATTAGADDDFSDDEEDDDFGSDDGSVKGSSASSNSDDSGLDSESDGEPVKEDAPVKKRKVPEQSEKKQKNKEPSSPAEKKSSKKKKKDVNAPKAAKSAYLYFCDAMRSDLKEREPDLTFGEVGKKLGTMWKELDEDAKAPWAEKAAEDKERYNNAMSDYVPPKQESDDEEEEEDNSSKAKPKKKKKKDENAPKGAKSAYMYFCDAMRSDLKEREPDLTFGEVGKKLGTMWKELDEDAKAPWAEKAAEDKERYNNAMSDYVPPKQESGDEEEETTSHVKKKAKKAKKDPNEPKRPLASYFIWMGENRETFKGENPEASIGELGKVMGAKWKTLTEEEKAPYNEKAAQNKEKYNEEMRVYNASKSTAAAEEPDVKEEEDDDGMSD